MTLFDPIFYRNCYQDLQNAYRHNDHKQLALHFINHGRSENRLCSMEMFRKKYKHIDAYDISRACIKNYNLDFPTIEQYLGWVWTNKIPVKNIENIKPKIFLSICTYDRSDILERLLTELFSQTTKYNFFVSIYDDNSTQDYSFLSNYNDTELHYYKSPVNNGKKLYYKNINHQLQLFKEKKTFDYFLQVDDDFWICDNFIDNCVYHITKHTKENKNTLAMRIHKDHRSRRKVWGTKNWVDGGTMYKRKFLESVNYQIQPIPSSRWDNNENLSSGVWEQLTRKMKTQKGVARNPRKSLVYHIGYNESKMNPEERKIRNIITNDFYGNKHKIHVEPVSTDKNVKISLTTIPERINQIEGTIKSLLNQTYKNYTIEIYLPKKTYRTGSRFSKLPDFLNHEKINIYKVNDLGSIIKIFYCIKNATSTDIVVTADDDVVYPNSWLETLIKYHKQYPSNPICFRGRNFNDKSDLNYNRTSVVNCNIIEKPQTVDIVTGVGGALYTKDMLPVEFFDFKVGLFSRVDDIWITGMLWKNHRKAIAVPLQQEIVATDTCEETSLWQHNKTGDYNNDGINRFKEIGRAHV